jgi:hypothetical protein
MAAPAPANDTTQQEAVQLACLALAGRGDASAAHSAAVLGAAALAFQRTNDALKLGTVVIRRVYPAFQGEDIVDGDTLLHAAVRRQLHEVTGALLEAGTPLGVRNARGETAFEVASPVVDEADPELEAALAESRRLAAEDEAQLAAALAASALEAPPEADEDDLRRAIAASKTETPPPKPSDWFARIFAAKQAEAPSEDLDAAVAASLAAEDADAMKRREAEDAAMARALAASEGAPPLPPPAALAAAAAAAGRKPCQPAAPPKRAAPSNVHPLAAAAAAEVRRRPPPPAGSAPKRPAAPSALAEALAAAAAKRRQRGPPKSPTRLKRNPFQVGAVSRPAPPPTSSPLHSPPTREHVATSKRIAELEATVAALRSELHRVNKPTEQQQRSIDDIEGELRAATARCLQGDPAAEAELERLDAALRAHPEHNVRIAKARAKWDSDQRSANTHALALMRSLVPPDILNSTANDVGLRICDALQSDGPPAIALAKRIWSAKALRAVRAPPEMLRKAHVADLRGTYTPTGLDLIELRAFYACLPQEFANDGDGAKAKWREAVREKLVSLVAREVSGVLAASEKRHGAYADLPEYCRLFPAELVAESWAPDAADPLAQPRRRASAAPAGLLAALQNRGSSRVGV